MNNIDIGVFGLGVMGTNHVRALMKNRYVNRIFIYDPYVKSLKNFDSATGLILVDKLDDILSRIDAAIICSNTNTHFDIAKFLIQLSIPTLIEKPVTATLEQAKKLKALSQTHNTKVCVGHIERFNPTLIELKKLLKEMTPLSVSIERLSYNVTRGTDVSVVLDLMLHDVDAVFYLFNGKLEYRHSHCTSCLTEVADHSTAFFMAGSVPITITASKISQIRKRIIQIACKEGFIIANLDRKEIKINKNSVAEYYAKNLNLGYKQSSLTETVFVPQVEPLVVEHEQFFKLINNEENSTVTIDDAINIFSHIEQVR